MSHPVAMMQPWHDSNFASSNLHETPGWTKRPKRSGAPGSPEHARPSLMRTAGEGGASDSTDLATPRRLERDVDSGLASIVGTLYGAQPCVKS